MEWEWWGVGVEWSGGGRGGFGVLMGGEEGKGTGTGTGRIMDEGNGIEGENGI